MSPVRDDTDDVRAYIGDLLRTADDHQSRADALRREAALLIAAH